MKVTVITLFPEMFENAMSFGVTARAFKEQGHELRMLQLRDFAIDKHRTVDDKPYGGGPGMLLKAEPLLAAIDAARAESAPDRKSFISRRQVSGSFNRAFTTWRKRTTT